MLKNVSRVGVRRMGPDSFRWCPATGQGATGTNCSIGSSTWTWGRTSLLWGQRSNGTGWPEGYRVSFSGDTQNPPGQGPVQPALGEPALVRVVGLDDPQRSLPIPTILWFCDSNALNNNNFLRWQRSQIKIPLYQRPANVGYHQSTQPPI